MTHPPLPPIPTRVPDVGLAEVARPDVPLATVVLSGAETPDAEMRNELRATGEAGEIQVVPGSEGPRWLVGAGTGTRREYRAAGAAFARAVADHLGADGAEREAIGAAHTEPTGTAQVRLPEEIETRLCTEFVTGALLGAYRYRVSNAEPPGSMHTLLLLGPGERVRAEMERTCERIAATALSRDLANSPANVKNPAWLARLTEDLMAEAPGLSVSVRDRQWLAERGFGGVLAVGDGSDSEPCLIELLYRPRRAEAHVLLVGKGVTFDTGGVSIKPAEGMHLMRTDMAGGGAVIAAMRSIAALRPNVRVTALVPAAENLVSGSSYRPGDVVRHYGGRTTEIGNTDAEGRMLLADALAYGTMRFAPDVVVDVATLTGAMKVALGLRTGGVFTNDDTLAERVCSAGERVGESWWRMPLVADHATEIRSGIADLRQAPSGPGGITAALFLREFIGRVPWAHLDIAGPARAEENYDEVVAGGTGFAARTLVEFVTSYA